MKDKKIILEGALQKFSPASYPGRIYGMYDWNWDKHEWEINENFCKKYNISH